MTPRKPPGIGWESWVERQIREAQERGEFDDLPGHGKPLDDVDRSRDEMWWVRKKLRREKVSYSPPALSLRVEVDETRERIHALGTGAAGVRSSVNEFFISRTVCQPPAHVPHVPPLHLWRSALRSCTARARPLYVPDQSSAAAPVSEHVPDV